MKRFIDTKFYSENYIALVSLIISIIIIKVNHLVEIYENSLVENLQVVVLFIAFIACFFAKKYKKLFYFAAMFIFLMIMRELSYGRAIFCQIPNSHNLYPWSHYKYGYLSDVVIGLYILSMAVFAFINKIWLDIIKIIKNIKFPIFTFLACVICVIAQLISEKYLDNTIIEETSELMLYSFILSFILIYLKK